MQTVSISDIKRDISELVNRVAFGGHRIVLTSRGRPKAAIIGLTDLERLLALEASDNAETRLQELATLKAARQLRQDILARTGHNLPDSAEELRMLREERDEQLGGLR